MNKFCNTALQVDIHQLQNQQTTTLMKSFKKIMTPTGVSKTRLKTLELNTSGSPKNIRALETDASDRPLRFPEELQSYRARIQELQNTIQMQQKEIAHLREMNRYLQLSNQQKLEIIHQERNFQKIPKPERSQGVLVIEEEFFPVDTPVPTKERPKAKYLKTMMIKSPKVSDDGIPSRKSILTIDREKPGMFNFVQLEETFRVSSALDPATSTEQAQVMYEKDGTLQLLNEIMKDEENFIDMMQNAKRQKLSFIYDKIQRILQEHELLFHMMMRLKNLNKVDLATNLQGAIQMSHSLLLDDALSTIVDEMVKCMECDRATCYIVDQERNEIWSRVAKGTHTTIRLPIGEGVAGSVASNRELVNIRNAYLDQRFNCGFDKRTDYKTKSLLACPILEGDRCIGVLQCVNKKGKNISKSEMFSKEDEQLIKIFAEFCGVVLGNAINNNEQTIQYNKLRHIIKSVTIFGQLVQHPDRLIKTAQLRVQALMGVDKARVSYLATDPQVMYHYDEKGQRIESRADQGILGQTIQSKTIQSSGNCYQDSRFNSAVDINTQLPVICIPIALPNDLIVLGAIQVIFLRSFSTNVVQDQLRISRIDQEIITLYSQIVAIFLNLGNQIGQARLVQDRKPSLVIKQKPFSFNRFDMKSSPQIVVEEIEGSEI